MDQSSYCTMHYRTLVTVENLFCAWDGFKKGKQWKPDVMVFERNLEDNLFALYQELITKTYCHQPYHTFHIWDPKHRVINKAAVRDRVVHHLLFRFLEAKFLPFFIHHSYSCQTGKGIHQAVEEVSAALGKLSRHPRQAWALKMDVKKFFDSVDHEILLGLLRRRVSDAEILWLLERVIRSFHSPQGHGKGLPIGNLTSQIFANIYLSELDYFAQAKLGARHYFRYADDFLLLHKERAWLERMIGVTRIFLRDTLGLTLHPHKVTLRKFRHGIDFCGYVLLPRHCVLRTKTKRRMFRKLRMRADAYNRGSIDEWTLNQSVQSYLGMLQHCNGYGLTQKLRNEAWISRDWTIIPPTWQGNS